MSDDSKVKKNMRCDFVSIWIREMAVLVRYTANNDSKSKDQVCRDLKRSEHCTYVMTRCPIQHDRESYLFYRMNVFLYLFVTLHPSEHSPFIVLMIGVVSHCLPLHRCDSTRHCVKLVHLHKRSREHSRNVSPSVK